MDRLRDRQVEGRRWKELSFIFKVAEDWIKLVKKYGRLGAKKRMNASDLMDKTIPSIAHPSEKRWLEVMKVGEYVEVYVTGYWSCTGRPYSPSSD
uniref:Reverse transcriptase domain-containing protein n=1 Tax=Steinernema glaseri TaxID=37863 RepID=A0A1I7ZV75_9BILA